MQYRALWLEHSRLRHHYSSQLFYYEYQPPRYPVTHSFVIGLRLGTRYIPSVECRASQSL